MNDTHPPRDPHHDNEAELRDGPDDIDLRTYAAIRTRAFREAIHALDCFANEYGDEIDEYKAALVTRCAALVRDLIDHDDAGRGPKDPPAGMRTVFTGSHGFAPPRQKDKL